MSNLRVEINKYDLKELERKLDGFEPKLRKKWARQAIRRAQRVHILPQVKRATPSGAAGQRGRSINTAGNRAHGRGQAKTWRGRKSTGKLRRSWKVAAMKRSRTLTGLSTVSYGEDTFYRRFLERGRTHNLFKPMSEWRKVPASRKGPSGDLWRPGRWMWLKVANRRGPRANRSAIRGIWDRIRMYSEKP